MKKFRFLIVGSGPTGLGAAWRLKELGFHDFLVIEKEKYVGGLASTFVDTKGFLWDIGGHVQFSHFETFDRLMDQALSADEWIYHERAAWVWMNGKFIPYPLQYNIRHLPSHVIRECIEGLKEVGKSSKNPADFGEWIIKNFGAGLAKHFFNPYNFKVWAFPPSRLGYGWVGERVAAPDLTRVEKNIELGIDDVSWGPNHRFRYPRSGGTGAIWKSLAQRIGMSHFHFDDSVDSVDPMRRTVTLRSGITLGYETLLSTMPVDLLCAKLEGKIGMNVGDLSSKLLHSSSHIVGIGLLGQAPPSLQKKCWIYFPENDCPFYRVTVFSNYSPSHVPDSGSNWSLLTETSSSAEKPVRESMLIEETLQGLMNTGLIRSREQVISTWQYRADYGYPTPSVERDSILRNVIPFLECYGIYSRGRFGLWKYEISNQDHSAMQGMEWSDYVTKDVEKVSRVLT